ncbi:MAG: molybdopterin-guanine dinucleotide biosynthesis protein B [Candidatus Heimdallarchaeaceae archaeon]
MASVTQTRTPTVIQVVGLSKTGKTTLITKIIKEFTSRDLKVNVIKSAKNHQYIYSGKDSDVFLKNGAKISTVVFQNAIQITTESEVSVKRLIEIAQLLQPSDLILLEGFKSENYPKILIWTEETKNNLELFNFAGLLYVLNTTEAEVPQLTSEQHYKIFQSQDELVHHLIKQIVE